MSSGEGSKQRVWVVTEKDDAEAASITPSLRQIAEQYFDGFDLQVNNSIRSSYLGVSILWSALKNFQKGDSVLVETVPPHVPFIAAFASLLKGCSYTLFIRDLLPDRSVALGRLRQNSAIVKVIHIANAWLYKHAARIIVVDSDIAELMSTRTEGLNIPILTL